MSTRSMQSRSASQPSAHDWVIVPLLSFLSALLLGAICTSLYYSYAAAGHGGADASTWQVLNAVGGFWNGHFGALTLVAVAWGLYFQMRTLRDEAQASRERASEAEKHMRHWMLSQLDSRRNDLARWMKGALAWQDEHGGWRVQRAIGADVVTNTLGTFLDRAKEGYCLLRITLPELREYAAALRTAAALIEECDRDEHDRLRAIFDVSRELSLIDSVVATYGRVVSAQREVFDRCALGAPDLELSKMFDRAVLDGWTFDLRDFSGTKVIDARCLSSDGDLLECRRVAPVETGANLVAELRQLLLSIESQRFERRKLEP